MSYQLIIRKRAEQQIEDAFNWYEKKKTKLGDEFLEAIDSCLLRLHLNPLAFQLKHKNIRAVYASQFPYGIFYFIDNSKIIVVAVFHLSRNPKLWRKL